MFKLLNVLYMIYMFNIFVLRNLTPLLGNVALRMGNLQVIKIRGVVSGLLTCVSRCSDT
jgi:hypothetical protein